MTPHSPWRGAQLKLKYDELLSKFAFKFNLRRYIQYAVIPDGTVYIIEANPRASRTVPFVAKVRRCRLTLSNPL